MVAVSGAGFGYAGGIAGTKTGLLLFYLFDSCLPAKSKEGK